MKLLAPALIYFHEVARTGSITLAAETQHVSASAISRQISNLERSAGVPLFERHPRGMTLTEAGLLLLAHARRTEAEGEALVEELRNQGKHKTRTIKVVSSEGLAHCRVPEAMARISMQHSDIAFHLDVVPSTEGTRRVIEGEADIAVVYALGPQRDVTVEFTTPTPAFAVVARDHPLAARDSLSMAELCAYKLALPEKGISQRELFDIAAEMEHVAPTIALVTNQVGPILEFARAGAGIALMSNLVVHAQETAGVVFIPLQHPVFHQRQGQIQTMTGRSRSAIFTAFIDALIDSLSAP